MDPFIILMIGIAVLFLFRKRPDNTRPQTDHLSETQRKWREHHQKSTPTAASSSIQEQIYAYIIKHKRPFHFSEWLISSVDPRMVISYIANMMIVLFVLIAIPLILGFPVFLDLVFLGVLLLDMSSYQRMLFLEVTLWNPEFNTKFPNNIQ